MDIAQIEIRDAVFEKYYIVDNLLTSRHIKQLEKSLQDVPYQEATTVSNDIEDDFRNTNLLCKEVISLPMHTELDEDQINFICEKIRDFLD